MKEFAGYIFSISPDLFNQFEILDEFNNNTLKGVICRQNTSLYGMMIIFKVNEEECLQIIYGTPKLHYPFDKNYNFKWPECQRVECWEKVDGTNVLAYTYSYHGQKFLTYKVRMNPIIKNNQFGLLKDLWIECLQNHPWIKELSLVNPDYNISFELIGSRNKITVDYPFPIKPILLFGVDKQYKTIVSPSSLLKPNGTILPRKYNITEDNLTESYMKLREEMSKRNKNGLIEEGIVVYTNDKYNIWTMFKCKPKEIEEIHWASDFINEHSLWTTAINSFENNPSFDEFVDLLKEEYSEKQIEKSMSRISKTYSRAKDHIILSKQVNEVWKIAKEKGFDVCKDKSETFRFMSKYFDKKQMGKIGTIVLSQAGLLEKKDNVSKYLGKREK